MTFQEYSDCHLCPHDCGADRNAGITGFCNMDAALHIASICIHKGEEPAISGESGICNVFFAHCNLQCIYCQNYQISNNHRLIKDEYTDLDQAVNAIISLLNKGCGAVGFVSPTHFLPHVKAIIRALNDQGYHPITVYNTNGYEKVSELRLLEDMIDIYLPDLKYFDAERARAWSGAADYPEMAQKAILEMFRQKGTTLRMKNEFQAESGLIIRHLVLPGCAEDSIRLLEWLARECSPRVHLSLMSQYSPTIPVKNHPVLGRYLLKEEYQKVVKTAENLGFTRGWTQEFSSQDHYLPDFNHDLPFGE